MSTIQKLSMFLLVACGLMFTPNAFAQKTDTKKDDTKKAADTKDEPKAVRHALPKYFKDIVDDTQKEKIYGIQDSYIDQIHKLQEAMDNIKAKRDGEIRKVLTAAQLKKLDALVAEASKDEPADDAKMDKKDSKKDDAKDTKKTDTKSK